MVEFLQATYVPNAVVIGLSVAILLLAVIIIIQFMLLDKLMAASRKLRNVALALVKHIEQSKTTENPVDKS